MDRKTLAHNLNISRQHLDYILARERRPSPELAATLEKFTGIERRAWLWPDEFHNQMIEDTSHDSYPKGQNGTQRQL